MFLLGTVRHVIRRIVTLKYAEHAAVAVAEQVADDKGISWVAAGLGDADMEQPIAGMGGRSRAVITAVLLVGLTDARQFLIGGVPCRQCRRFGLDQQTGLQQ
ncbi:hypothetical protein D3C78_1649630 [compost metagenome]